MEHIDPAKAKLLDGIRAAHPELQIELKVGELPRAIGNAELLRQVWVNLLDAGGYLTASYDFDYMSASLIMTNMSSGASSWLKPIRYRPAMM